MTAKHGQFTRPRSRLTPLAQIRTNAEALRFLNATVPAAPWVQIFTYGKNPLDLIIS